MTKNPSMIFFLLLIVHLLIWPLIPSLTNHNLPLETIEALKDFEAIFELIQLINSTPLFLMSGDNPFSEFCAGVWFVRNNNTGKLLINQWIQLYYNKYHKFWYKDNKTNQFKSNMPFAIHPCYEQPAFIKHILPKYNITKLPWYVLNNPIIPFFDNSATLHFYGHFKNTIPIYLHLNSYF